MKPQMEREINLSFLAIMKAAIASVSNPEGGERSRLVRLATKWPIAAHPTENRHFLNSTICVSGTTFEGARQTFLSAQHHRLVYPL